MARRAIRDTYGYEPVGQGLEVRRLVKAGQPIPDGCVRLDDESAAVEDRRTTLSYRLHAKAAGTELVEIGTNQVRRAKPRAAAPASGISVARESPEDGPKGRTTA
jgi:hypothetical protein